MNAPHTSPNGAADSTEPDASASDRSEPTDRAPTGGPEEAWAEIVSRVAELREYAGYYIAANVDRLRLSGRSALMWAIIGVVAGLAAIGVVTTASVLLVVGLSRGVAELVGGRLWLGQIIVSSTVLLAASCGVWFVLRRSLRRYERMLRRKYELRKEEERSAYGTDVEKRARERAQIQ